MPSTLKDIARESQVSQATVSLVLNGRDGVNRETRKRVEGVLRRMKYRPSLGRPVHRPRAWNIAAVYARGATHMTQGATISALAGTWMSVIRDELIERGGHLTVFAGAERAEDDPLFQRVLAEGELDGAILMGTGPKDSYFEALSAASKPVVVMNRRPQRDEFSYVAMDNYGGGKLAAERLLELGHKRIAHVCGPETLSFRLDRTAGFEERLAATGLTPSCTEMIPSVPSQEQVKRTCRALLESGATGAFFDGDDRARPCLDELALMGISVPGRLSIVGFDNDEAVSDQIGTRPTSVGYDRALMGTMAARILMQLMEDPQRARAMSFVVKSQVYEHGTTGPAEGIETA